mgnify:CR=1 FL=1
MDKVKEKGDFFESVCDADGQVCGFVDPSVKNSFLHWKDIKVLCQKKSLKICFGM